MKAMVLAAGLGTRLKPHTDIMPKALVPIAGKPLLQHIIEKLKAAGADEIIINIHHFPEQIVEFVEKNRRFDIRIEFSDESNQLLDTGGALKKASWFFDEDKPFIMHNVDIVSNINITDLFNLHQNTDSMATLACSDRQTSRYLLFDKSDRLCGWLNKSTGEVKSPYPDFEQSSYKRLAFSGIQVIQPRLLDYMQDWPDVFSIIDFYLSLCDKEILSAYNPLGMITFDAGKPDTLKDAERFMSKLK